MKRRLLSLAFLLPAFSLFAQYESAQLYLPFDGFLLDLARTRTVTPHGSPSFGTNAKGEANKALVLTGTQYLDVDTNFIKGDGSYSMAVSFMPADLTGYHFILHSGAFNGFAGYAIGTFNSKPFVTYRSATGTFNNNAIGIDVTLEMDKWYQLIAVYQFDASNPATLKVYINGTMVGDFTGTAANNGAPYSKLFIGSSNETSNFWKGKLDDLAVFNKALTPNEVALLYGAIVAGFEDKSASSTTCSQLVSTNADGISAPQEAHVVDLQGKSFSPSYISEGKAHFSLNAGLYLVHDAANQCKTKVVVR